jgi:glycosyltransferase involved in cell wall biosynthesis
MKVLLVSQEYPPETAWGGIGTYAGLHAPALAAADAEVHVLSVVAGQAASDVQRDGVHVHRRGLMRVRGPGRVLPQTWKRLQLAAAVARHARSLPAVDVVESPEWMAESLFVRGRPLVVRLHSSAAQVFPFVGRSGADARLAIGIEHRGMRRADALVGSDVQVSTVPFNGGGPAVVEIPYPIGVRERRPAWEDGVPRIVFAGRFEWRKGPDRLVAALPAVRREVPEVRLQLVGRDTTDAAGASVLEALLARARELGVADAVEVIDAWGRDAVEAALHGAAVCAVPSRWESFGYVAAEALAGATPTVTSSWPSLAGIAGDERVVVRDDDDPAAWARALTWPLADPAAARAAALAGRERLIRDAGPDVVAARTLEVYRRVTRR